MQRIRRGDVVTLYCAAAGSVLGYAAFAQLRTYGIYASALPGGLTGLAAGIPRSRAAFVPVLCGVLATAAGLFAEHQVAPFIVDLSLGYFLQHVFDLQPLTLISIAVGGIIGFWVPFRRRVRGSRSAGLQACQPPRGQP